MIGNTDSKGFTLVEVLVATAVIGVAIALAVDLFVIFFQNEHTAGNEIALDADARTTLSLMIERTRQGYVDYEFYDAAPSAEPTYLAVRDVAGNQTVFWFAADAQEKINIYLCDGKTLEQTCPKNVDPEADGNWKQLNPEDTVVPVGLFRVIPDVAPYVVPDVTWSNEQPLITVVLQLQKENQADTSSVIQTSFTPRLYVR